MPRGKEARSPLEVWRITSARYAERAFDGEGARLYGGRWNHPGTPVVYVSRTLSLYALEYFVHLEPEFAPKGLVAIRAEVLRTFESGGWMYRIYRLTGAVIPLRTV